MDLKTGELLNMQDALAKLSQEKLPIKAAYWVSRVQKLIEPEVKAADEQRNVIVQKFGTEVEGGGMRIQTEKMQEFMAEMGEVLSSDISIAAGLPKITLDKFGSVEIQAAVLLPLSALIEE